MELGVIFIAIPKTGTTSVRGQLTQKGEAIIHNAHLNIRQVKELLYVFLLKQTMGTNLEFPNDRMPSDDDLRTQANALFQSYFKFSSVRNPWARAVSMYFRREGVKTRDDLTFEQFIEGHHFASDTCRQPTLHQNQFDWLCDENGILQMDYVYKVEELEEAIPIIREKTSGKVVLRYAQKNQNKLSKSETYQEMYTDHTRKLIASRFEKDIDTFKYVF